MDAHKFEMLLRGWSSAQSRRQTLILAAVSALGAVLSLSEISTEAKKKGKKKKKKDKKKSPPPPPPPPANTSTCQFDSDCNGNPNGSVCCYEEGPSQCELCCLTGNRGCPPGMVCSIGTYADKNICVPDI